MKKFSAIAIVLLAGALAPAEVFARAATRPTPPSGGPTPPPAPTNPVPRPSAAGAAQNSGLFVTSTTPSAKNGPSSVPPTGFGAKPSSDP